MSRSVSRASWGEEVSSPRVGTTLSDYRECSALAIPVPRFAIFCLVSIAFAFENRLQYNFGTRPSTMDTPAENARGEKCLCLTHPPVRAQKRREEKKTACSLEFKIKFLCMKLRVLFFQLVLFYFFFQD